VKTKVCSVCNIEKELNDFYLRSDSKDGYRNDCKVCFKKRTDKYRENNSDLIKEYRKKYFKENQEVLLKKKQEWRKNNPEKYKERTKKYYERTKKVQFEKKKKWIEENRETYNSYWTTRKKEDPEFNLITNMRSRLCNYLKKNNITKKNKTFDIIGCSPEFLKKHLEKQFKDGMSWENRNEWHIDHIIPLSSAETEERLYELCHYTNLQPLWAEENIKKGNKIL